MTAAVLVEVLAEMAGNAWVFAVFAWLFYVTARLVVEDWLAPSIVDDDVPEDTEVWS